MGTWTSKVPNTIAHIPFVHFGLKAMILGTLEAEGEETRLMLLGWKYASKAQETFLS